MVKALPHFQLLHFPASNDTLLLFRPGFKDHIAQLAGAEVVGEFEDSALLKTFGASGTGVFLAAEAIYRDLINRPD